MKRTLLAAAAMAAAPALAAEPVQVTASYDPTVWYVDTASIEQEGSMRQAWVVVEHFEQERLRFSERMLLSIDCSRKRFRPLEVATYGSDGALLRRASVTEKAFGYRVYQPFEKVGKASSYVCRPQNMRWLSSGFLMP